MIIEKLIKLFFFSLAVTILVFILYGFIKIVYFLLIVGVLIYLLLKIPFVRNYLFKFIQNKMQENESTSEFFQSTYTADNANVNQKESAKVKDVTNDSKIITPDGEK